MASTWLRFVGGSAALLAALQSSTALGFTETRATLTAGPRYGSDNLGFGLGAGGGFTLAERFYLGGTFDYFFGTRKEVAFEGVNTDTRFSALLLMPTLGYDWVVAEPLVLRPNLSLGLVSRFYENCTDGVFGVECADTSNSELSAAAGGQALFDLAPLVLGAELRFAFGEFEGLWLGLNLGMML